MTVLRTTQSAKRSSDEERRVEETSPSDDVAEMHKVMCESDWPDK